MVKASSTKPSSPIKGANTRYSPESKESNYSERSKYSTKPASKYALKTGERYDGNIAILTKPYQNKETPDLGKLLQNLKYDIPESKKGKSYLKDNNIYSPGRNPKTPSLPIGSEGLLEKLLDCKKIFDNCLRCKKPKNLCRCTY
ncbi:hypothetical protein CL617_00440 [archaeon]|nr:hypothetical protein [archaeon]|tara:strand:+ start:824 stop:1255 length:432 start_codon:yes stop_codon:yes gene_type:complete